MSTTYAHRQTIAQKKDISPASSVLDASSQSKSLQRKADMANNAAQRAEAPRPNNTGMPDNLKAGIECLSGFSMDDVRVHYNSSKPATVQALAYTQGTDIHVAPGQEKHLPHEAWHVAQQMAGRVSPTTNINGMPVNDNAALEHEADVMGEKAVQCKGMNYLNFAGGQVQNSSVQRMAFYNGSMSKTNQVEGNRDLAEFLERRQGDQRSRELSGKVDQYKKEMLTYIASKIEEKNDFGPHISVVITGRKWYIAVNSNVKDQVKLNGCVKRTWDKITKDWLSLYRKRMKFQSTIKENNDLQAAYITLRWVGSCSGYEVIKNDAREDGTGAEMGRVHGEMQILSNLRRKTALWQEKKRPKSKIEYERVVRVGGTKTPCGDCFFEMGGAFIGGNVQGDYRAIDHLGRHIHGKVALRGVGNRHVVTMTENHGRFFNTWMPPSAVTNESTRLHQYFHHDAHENNQQNQDCEMLKRNCKKLGVVL